LCVILILPIVSCFFNCGFGEGFASHWLWDPMGAFWGPLIFFFQGSHHWTKWISTIHHLV
jgi:hypothetical protein